MIVLLIFKLSILKFIFNPISMLLDFSLSRDVNNIAKNVKMFGNMFRSDKNTLIGSRISTIPCAIFRRECSK